MADSDDEGPPRATHFGEKRRRARIRKALITTTQPAPKRTKRSRAGKGGGRRRGRGSGGNDEEEEPKKKRRKPGKATPCLRSLNNDLNSDLVSFRDTKDRRTVSKRFELFPAANLQSWIVKRLSGPMIRYKLAIFNTIGTSIVKNSPGGRGRDYQTAPWHVWRRSFRAVFIWDSNFDETLAVKRRPDVFKAQRNFYKQLGGPGILHVAKHGFCEREFSFDPDALIPYKDKDKRSTLHAL
ncbi:hypothetical protein R3P38DRAFT_3049841 [Favolaschia claudopus]|uniref:Uncharacterized protein n=1 Tax=Favolaschia claudopus TaxID=2862362 RepID=A0AAW0A690_9AGAR